MYVLPLVESSVAPSQHGFYLNAEDVLLKTEVGGIVADVCALYFLWSRYRELQEKLNVLEQNSIQRDRIEAVLKQKEKDCIQVNKHTHAYS